MNKDRVLDIYRKLLSGESPRITYSKGYPIFEEIYELYKDDLEREEQGLYVVVKRKDGKEIKGWKK